VVIIPHAVKDPSRIRFRVPTRRWGDHCPADTSPRFHPPAASFRNRTKHCRIAQNSRITWLPRPQLILKNRTIPH
jgi:hypothetical protein